MKFSAAHHRAKATIKACVESGAGIEFLPDAPTFRYTPNANKPFENRGPSSRQPVPCGSNRHKLKNWQPLKLDTNPMYHCPMAGDSFALTEARAEWAKGNALALRELLAEQAEARRAGQQLELKEAA